MINTFDDGYEEHFVETAPPPSLVVEKLLFERRKTPDEVKEAFTIRLYPGTLKALDELSEELGTNRATLARMLLEGALAEALEHLESMRVKEPPVESRTKGRSKKGESNSTAKEVG